MTKYAEDVRNQYRSWLVEPKKAAQILKQRGGTEAAEKVFNEIEEIEQLIEQVHGGRLAPETSTDQMNIHVDIIYRCAGLDGRVNETLRPIYAELATLEQEKDKEKSLTVVEKPKFWQRLFRRKKQQEQKKEETTEQEQIESYTDECVQRFMKFNSNLKSKYNDFDKIADKILEERLIGKYYRSFVK